MNPKTEKAIKKWIATPIEDRDINAFKDGRVELAIWDQVLRVELAIWDQVLGAWQTVAKFTTRPIIAKRYPKRRKVKE